MSQEDVTQMRVNQQSVGMIGLKQVMEEMAAEWAHRSEREVRAELMRRVSKKNYVPAASKEAYGKALLREFNKLLGRPYEEETSEGLEIKILGPGCARCEGLERDVMEVAAEMGLAAAIEHVRDMKVIASYGVIGTPALVVNGKVVSVGNVATKTRIKGWFREGV
ncbi:MAG: thioredoxin family protein [Thermodesulfobacteriota bacterium]|nr:thioredoxin family protein [Thermodesulfobacteriota bacterium]